jgi:hypothetical protein
MQNPAFHLGVVAFALAGSMACSARDAATRSSAPSADSTGAAVELLSAGSTITPPPADPDQWVGYVIAVQNFSYNKSVVVHELQSDGTPLTDDKCYWVRSSGNNYEIWKTSETYMSQGGTGITPHDLIFWVEYVDLDTQQSYRDDNGGAYYKLGSNDGMMLTRPVLVGSFQQQAGRDGVMSGTVGINVRALGGNEQVTVVGSDDGWQTTRVLQATLQPGNASASGVETWAVSTGGSGADPSSFLPQQFAISFGNGSTGPFWDNDFGENYSVGQGQVETDQSPF